MNKEEIAKKNLQEYENLSRAFKGQALYFDTDTYREGSIITLKEAKSFAGQGAGEEFQVETSFDGQVVNVVFNCEGAVLAHKVDYQDKDEVEALSAVKGEDEYLVPTGTHFEITCSSNEDDITEMGYFEVDIKQISEEEYQNQIEKGATEIYAI